MTYMLINATKEQQKIIVSQKSELENLKKEIQEMKNLILDLDK